MRVLCVCVCVCVWVGGWVSFPAKRLIITKEELEVKPIHQGQFTYNPIINNRR